MTHTQYTPDRGTGRIASKVGWSLPRWLRSILGIPLEMKLLGANLIIVIVAVSLFGGTSVQPARLGDAYVLVVALIVGAAVNLALGESGAPPPAARPARRAAVGRAV